MTQAAIFTENDALFSECGTYRYGLLRGWGKGEGVCLFVMLNPSTADAETNDPTVERCERFAKSWGYGALAVVNLYALRSTDPKALLGHPDPVGPVNAFHIAAHASMADLVVCAWGNHGTTRARQVVPTLRVSGIDLHCLGVNKTGEPVHPLYQPKDLKPQPFLGIYLDG